MSVINDIHWDIFTRFKWQPDSVTFGRIEHWDMPVEKDGMFIGDCDDFSVFCYHKLKESGYSPELAVCKVPSLGGHAVCIVQDKEWYVLDNRFRSVYKLTDNPGNYYDWARSDGNWRNAWINFRLENK